MALTVVATPLDPACNSYVSLAEMVTYVSERMSEADAELWNELDSASKARYVVNATRALDSFVEWIGVRYSDTQKLKWPRFEAEVDGVDLDYLTFPQAVKHATCELAFWMASNDGSVAVRQQAAFDSVKVGPININFNEQAGGSLDKYFPDSVAIILRDYGSIANPNLPGSKQVKMARLLRA